MDLVSIKRNYKLAIPSLERLLKAIWTLTEQTLSFTLITFNSKFR